MPLRTCDNCGVKMPMFRPRNRVNHQLLCDGCTPWKPGYPGRPVGHHGARQVEELHCEACGTPMGADGLNVVAGKLVCPEGCKVRGRLVGTEPRGKAGLAEWSIREVTGERPKTASESREDWDSYSSVGGIEVWKRTRGNAVQEITYFENTGEYGARLVTPDGSSITESEYFPSFWRAEEQVELLSRMHRASKTAAYPRTPEREMHGCPDCRALPGEAHTPMCGIHDSHERVPPHDPVSNDSGCYCGMVATKEHIGSARQAGEMVTCDECRGRGRRGIGGGAHRCKKCGGAGAIPKPYDKAASLDAEAGRFPCDGSNAEPLANNGVDEDGYTSTTIGNFTQHHDSAWGVCPVCREPKRLLRSGRLPKHTRYLSWKEQGEMGLRPQSAVVADKAPWEREGPAPWERGHEGHDIILVSTSWGEKAQCDTCRTVLAAWSDASDSDEPLGYIPAGVTWTPSAPPRQAKVASAEQQHIHRTAHDSGDGQTVYHCPFCGAGQVVGGADGTITCDYCKTNFTVQVQPEHASTPQTDPLTGEPIDMPGMPGQRGDAAGAEQQPFGQDQPAEAAPPFQPPGAPPAFKPPAQQSGNGVPPAGGRPVAAALYLTANGDVLPEEAFMRHIAVRYAEDREGVLASIRQERSTVDG